MEAFQLVFDEGDNHENEILSDYGTDLILQCFKDDFSNYAELCDTKTQVVKPYWDCNNHLNWDYMLSGVNELVYYIDFWIALSNETGDSTAETHFAIARELIQELQQEITDVLMYTAGNTTKLQQDLESYKYWSEMFYSVVYIEQGIKQTMLDIGVV